MASWMALQTVARKHFGVDVPDRVCIEAVERAGSITQRFEYVEKWLKKNVPSSDHLS